MLQQATPLMGSTKDKPRIGGGSGDPDRRPKGLLLLNSKDPTPEALHLIRMAQSRASSSTRFLRFFSDSSEELGDSA
jgi:hypothetical protein